MLPIVNPDIGFSLSKEISPHSDESYLTEQLSRIEAINPAISAWILHYAEKTEDPLGAMFCGVLVYRLLESQDECDQMNRDFKFS